MGHRALLGGILVTLVACRLDGAEDVVISEFLAANTRGLTDVAGETSDWIEVHNRGNAPVSLEGWCLTDKLVEPEPWRFPGVVVPPNGYLLVFASGKPQRSTPAQLHTSFRLKATPDHLVLSRPNGSIVQKFAPYPEQRNDVSFGLTASGAEGYFSPPTPGAPNGPGGGSSAARPAVGSQATAQHD